MKKPPDIYWIAIEGNRSFESYDKFSKNKIFEKLSNKAILFSNTIATATSTLMSTSSFFTGRFSYELYYAHEAMKQFDYKNSYPKELEKKGYDLNSIFFSREGNEFYKNYLNVHLIRDDYKSVNNIILDKFKEVMNSKISKNKPRFFYIHLAPTKEAKEPDFKNFKKGKLYRLMDAVNFKFDGKNFTYHSDSVEEYKKKGTAIIHWLPKDEAVTTTVLMPSNKLIKGLAELAALKSDVLQFERFGFCKRNNKEFWYAHK